MRCTAAGFAPNIISSDAVVWRVSWKRIGITFPTGQSFMLHLGQRRRLRALGRPVVCRTDATTIRELRRLGGLLKKIHMDSGGAYSQQTAAALVALQAAIASLAGREPGGAT
jgi:hypothetical protein